MDFYPQVLFIIGETIGKHQLVGDHVNAPYNAAHKLLFPIPSFHLTVVE